MLIEHLQKNLDWHYIIMLCPFLNKSMKPHLTKQQVYVHLPPISWIIQSKIKKICRAQLENQRQTHKQYSTMDSYTWIHQCWPIGKDLHTSALCGHRMQSKRLSRMLGMSGYLCNLMMIIIKDLGMNKIYFISYNCVYIIRIRKEYLKPYKCVQKIDYRQKMM